MYNVGDKVKVLKGNFCVGEEVYLERKHVSYDNNRDVTKYWHVISNDKSQFCLIESGMQFVRSASEAKLLLVESIKRMKMDYGISKNEDVLKKRSWYPEGSIAYQELTWLSDALYVYDKAYKQLMEKEGATTVFKIGDRVRVRVRVKSGIFMVNEVGTVRSLNTDVLFPDGTQWHVVKLDRGNTINVSEKNLEVVKENNTMKLNLKNGVTVEGTPEEVMKIAKQLGVDLIAEGYYNSSTHGLIKISDMDTRHVTNATLKAYRVFVEGLSKLSLPDVVKAMQNGPSDKEFNNLFTELVKR